MPIIRCKELSKEEELNNKPMLKVWEKLSKQTTTTCLALGCDNTDIEAAKVMYINDVENKLHLYPLCERHRTGMQAIIVSSIYKIVPFEDPNLKELKIENV
jgi:hypothetical protein